MSHSTREQRKLLYEQLIGTEIAGKYRISGLLGFGGMGAVYEAIQSPMGRKVALKLIPTHNVTAAARFEREAYTVSQLVHPNTVTVFDFGQAADGHLFLSMEHLEGHTLSELIKREAPLAPGRVVHIASQICRALGEAHRLGIIHRDIKPDNIFLIRVDGDPDYVKVLDFGIAKALHGEEDVGLTAEGRIVGTPRYMAPEQILAQPIDHRSDIYSLGCILFEMVCGGPPFEQQSTAALMMSHAQLAPPRFASRLNRDQLMRMPAGLESVVHQTMAKNADARPQTTEHLRELLGQALRINQAYELDAGPSTQNARPLPGLVQDTPLPPGTFEPQTGDFSRQTGDFRPGTASPSGLHTSPASPLPERSRAPLVGAILVLVLLLGGMVTWIVAGRTPEPEDKASLTVLPPEIAKHVPEPIRVVHLVTIPAGAEVFLGEDTESIGQTPLEIEAESLTSLSVYTLKKPGYQPQALSIVPGRIEASYTKVLEPLPQAPTEVIKPEEPAPKERSLAQKARERRARERRQEAEALRAAQEAREKLQAEKEASAPKKPVIKMLGDDTVSSSKKINAVD